MKRLILSLAALTAVAAPLALAPSAALADRKDERRVERRTDRVDERRGDRAGRPADRRFEREDRRIEPRNDGRGRDERGARGRRFEEPRFYAPRPPSWRRGAILPPGARGVRIYAYDRHRLRAPPPGYTWYQVGEDYLLTQTVTGMILEVVPGR